MTETTTTDRDPVSIGSLRAEFEAAGLEPGERGRLEPEREVLRHAEALKGGLANLVGELYGDEGALLERLKRIERFLSMWRSEVAVLGVLLQVLAAYDAGAPRTRARRQPSAPPDWEPGRLRGASPITMQTARNLFLWPGGGFVRKAVEAPLALAIDFAWPKRRVVEVYLNIVEWGPGIYGAEAAAQAHFGVAAADLTERQAALLAAVLPNPRRWSAGEPTGYIVERAAGIRRRAGQLGPLLDCLAE